MKIAIVAPEVFPVPPVRGGAVETVIEEVSAHLRGHDVHIFSIADPLLPNMEIRNTECGMRNEGKTNPKSEFRNPNSASATGCRTYRRWRPNWLDRLLLCSWKLPFKQSASRWYYRPYAHWVAQRVKRLNPDVIWVHSRVQFVPALRQAAPKARLILSLHNESNFAGDAVWSERAIVSVDVFTGCSGYLTDALKRARPSCAAKAKVLYNGVDPNTFAPRWARHEERKQLRQSHNLADGPVVLYVGRLVEAKGVHMLIEAFTATQAAIPDATLVIVGSHTFSDATKTAYIHRLWELAAPLGERVRFVGHVGREAIHQYFLMADVLAFPSTWQEPFGMVILEAQSAGLPVVAFDHGGPSEIIRHGRNGLLVDRAQEAAGFAEALTRCLGDSTMREVIGREARWTVEERFTWRGVAEELLRLAGASSRTRVLIAESGTGYGGSAKYLHELLTVLDRRYEVQVAAEQDGPFIRKIREQGVPVTLTPAWRFPRDERWGRVHLLLGGTLQLLTVVPVIVRWLKTRQVQLVHLNNEILTHLPLLLAAKIAGCRVVCHLHGWRLLTQLERLAAPLVDELVCITHAGSLYYAQQFKRQVVAIPNGIALNGHVNGLDAKRAKTRGQLKLSDNDRVVMILGRLIPWKGQDIVLKALAQLAPRYPGLRGLVVGQDPAGNQAYLTHLQNLAQELGIGARVQFVGWQDDVWGMYAASDIVVHASTQPEPFGLVLLEAMAAGRPVIATRAGGVVDIVSDGQTGLLVEPGQADALASAISRLLDDKVLSAALVQRARARVSTEFVITRNAAQLTALYDHLAARR